MWTSIGSCCYCRHIKFGISGFTLVKFRDPRRKVSSIFHTLSLRSFSVKDMYALSGGRAGSCISLEMFFMCLTKVICKQKRNPIENMLLCHGTTPCFCVPRACLITFKEHFQTAFWEACQLFFFLRKFSKQFGFAIFIFLIWALNN